MGALRSLSDSELAGRLAAVDTAAVEEVYLRYWGLLYQHARKMLRDDAQAEDIVQDIFVYLMNNLGRLSISTSLSSYLYRAVRNRVIDCLDKDSNRQRYVNSIKAIYERGEYVTDETIRENEMKKRIEDAVEAFPPNEGGIFNEPVG
ncbi:RNA polymerase sigma factor [Chitinophaga pinensis]|uniref:RNA polymerase, sigma-24 subunit, ECF subfamily n=1 Tax=Chitinophaga pinensis (strain ATCC 43595 / DSM 2588 / LMG 13176 / NBRC 15968 / NCIMB 11800 / UQM 2034) TaxID=485918 RepID=A0A979G707_CHIPD|nr:sigma-70 family RNA polymerase sigma factor [Chitinophaga pinensis]ACU62094.1 RNA polymerase, sigma-24 subunit, ECF subfamily [Chitinophaga pinensis DSM 2588]